MLNVNGSTERPIDVCEADLTDWPWLADQVEQRDGAYYPARIRGDHGDPAFQLHIAARRLGIDVRCIDGVLRIDLGALRAKVEEHHWLRHAEGFNWCPACGCDLSGVGALPPAYALLAETGGH